MTKKNLNIKYIPKKYLKNHIIEMTSRSRTTQSVLDFSTLVISDIKGSDLLKSNYDFNLNKLKFYPFFIDRKYTMMKVSHKNNTFNENGGVILLQDKKNKKINLLYLVKKGKKLKVAPGPVFSIIQGSSEYGFKVRKLHNVSIGTII